ncbi:hypothetical protein [Streptomyces sp. NPDC055036]
MNSDGWYFIALPDCAGGERVARRVGSDAQLICRHASGRPLLLARGPERQRVVAEAGAVRVAVVGGSSATEEGLRGQLGRPGGVRLLDGLGHSLAGSFHLVAAEGERLRVQGSASGLRRVFHAVIDGVRVVSDRADVLAGLGGFALDDTALAIRLLRVLPHPLAEEPMWREVEAVPPGSALPVSALTVPGLTGPGAVRVPAPVPVPVP